MACASLDHQPVLRPTFFDFADDPSAWLDNDEMMVGPDLLVAPVFEPGARRRTLHLPAGAHAAGWFEWATGRYLTGGQSVTVDAPLHQLPLFVRTGTLLPTTAADHDHAGTDEPSRLLHYFPAPGASGRSAAELHEDDGLRRAGQGQDWRRHRFEAEAGPEVLTLQAHAEGPGAGIQGALPVRLPAGERRRLRCVGSVFQRQG